MWPSITPASNAPDLVVDATMRFLPHSSAVFLLVSLASGLLALLLTARKAWVLRARTRQQARDLEVLEARERRLRRTVQESEDGLVHLTPVRDAAGAIVDFTVSDANTQAMALFRRGGQSVEGVRTSMLASLADGSPLFRSLVATLERGGVFRSEVRAHPRHLVTSWLWVRAVAVDGGLAVTLTDIRDRKREAMRLRRASLTDELTGLLNRRGFNTLAEARLSELRRHGQDAALFYLDCDRFKELNDAFGHPAGDRALREIGRALRAAVRETDVVARMGGDEFTILALDALDGSVQVIQQRIEQRIAELNLQASLPIPVGVSIGAIHVAHGSVESLEQLLARADEELLAQKRSRRAARNAMREITRSTRSPRPRDEARRGKADRELTGAVSAA